MCLVPQTSRTAPGDPNIEGSATHGAVIGAVLSCLLVRVADFSRQTCPGTVVVTAQVQLDLHVYTVTPSGLEVGPLNEVLQKDLEGILLETMTSLQDTFLSSVREGGLGDSGEGCSVLTPLVHYQGGYFCQKLGQRNHTQQFWGQTERMAGSS